MTEAIRSTPRSAAEKTAEEGPAVGEEFVLGEPASRYDAWARALNAITHEFFADRDPDHSVGQTLVKLGSTILALTAVALVVVAGLGFATVLVFRVALG